MAKDLREPIVLDVNHMMSDIIGFQYGIDADHVDGMCEAAAAAQRSVQKNRGTGWLGWMELPYNQAEIVEHIEKVAAKVRGEFEALCGAWHRWKRAGSHRYPAGAQPFAL